MVNHLKKGNKLINQNNHNFKFTLILNNQLQSVHIIIRH